MDELVSKQKVIDLIDSFNVFESRADQIALELKVGELPSAQPYTIHSDGRLWVTVDDIDKVNAVVVDENKSKFCKQFYLDAQPEIIYCKDCKYWHSGSCECPEYIVFCQDYMVGDIETEAEHFCGYAERRKG